jgi:hypothetical protein
MDSLAMLKKECARNLRPDVTTGPAGITSELTHAGPKAVAREAELRWPSGVVCSDFFGSDATRGAVFF